MARRARPLLLPLLAALALVPRLAAQSPTRFLVCESRDNACAQPTAALDQTWTFNGTEGMAGGSAGPASLSIQKFDSTALVVQRTDSSGLTALYSGAVQGARVRGTVQWSWPGHAGYPASGIFSAVLQDSVAQDSPAAPTAAGGTGALSLPPQLLVCENQGPPCNAAWSFHGTEGTAVWFDQNHTHAHLTIVRAEPDYLVIRRTDTNSPNTAVYTGSLRGDRYVGTIVYSSPGHPGDRTGSWTGTVPTFHCDPHDDLSRQEATTLGQTALMFHHGSEAMACYTLAANDGDVTAERVVGLLYYQGSADVPQDYAQALHWLQRAADQGVYQAQRLVSEMYAAGQGTKPNPALAKIYAERADEQKHDFERQQDLAEREADRRTQVLSSFVLGASFGLFW